MPITTTYSIDSVRLNPMYTEFESGADVKTVSNLASKWVVSIFEFTLHSQCEHASQLVQKIDFD